MLGAFCVALLLSSVKDLWTAADLSTQMVRLLHQSHLACVTKAGHAAVRFCGKHFHAMLASLLLFALAQYFRYDMHRRYDAGNGVWWAYPDVSVAEKDIPDDAAYDRVLAKLAEESKALKPRLDQKPKIILVRRHPYDSSYSLSAEARECGRCEITLNESLWATAHAVVYHFDYASKYGIKRSFDSQLLVWLNHETPWTTLHNLKLDFEGYDNQFNFTMTYRRDSDVYAPYFLLPDILSAWSDSEKKAPPAATAKTKFVAWVAGNCAYTKGSRQRLEMVKKLLQQGLKIDIFGACVLRYVSGSWSDLPSFLSRYKFYLSFENALHCRDYITEKTWWNALYAGAVPVIWGPKRADVEAVLPKNSYIFVEDFARPSDLIEKLQHLDQHDDEYAKYLAWQDEFVNTGTAGRGSVQPNGYCRLCLMLHADEHRKAETGIAPSRRVVSLREFWYDKEDPVCMSPSAALDLPHAWYQWCAFMLEYYCHAILWRRFYAVAFLILLLFLTWRRARRS